MNRFAYRTTGLVIKALENLSKARITLHRTENIPDGNNIFVINHFTRLETFVMPYYLNRLTRAPVWSLAAPELFKGALGAYLDKVGAVSTRDPDRDRLVVRTLLTGEAMWIIFPEGRMVKTKQIVEKGRLMLTYAGVKRPPHTGAAAIAIRTEFYRRRFSALAQTAPQRASQLLDMFGIESIQRISAKPTYIVPVNITYYPLRARENLLSELSTRLVADLPERVVEEIMTEGSMLISGVDMDIRFGEPLSVDGGLNRPAVKKAIEDDRSIGSDESLSSQRLMRRSAAQLMQRYMHRIYDMTTVNFDHLMASLLRAMPLSRTTPENLRAKAFLAATADFDKMGVFRHASLTEDPLPLLTRNAAERYHDFMRVACDRGCVAEKDGKLAKSTHLSGALDFHGVRIHNPVWVMANEVEPLKSFQRHIRRIAWQPSFFTRRKIVRRLLRSAVQEYKEDYRRFFVEGETKDRRVGMPLLFRGASRQLGVVLLHGYMAAPLEVAQLARYLKKMGVWVYAPRLKGHGTSPDDLAQRTYKDWIRSAETGYAVMRNICRRVLVGGFSTGAGLALYLAAVSADIAGVFAVSAPMQLQDIGARFAATIDAWNRLVSSVGANAVSKDFVENTPEHPHINYIRNPIAGVKELEALMEDLDPLLPDIKVPALVVQADEDPVVNARGSRRIFDRLGASDKTYVLFARRRHGILLGEGSQQVHRVIGSFVETFKND